MKLKSRGMEREKIQNQYVKFCSLSIYELGESSGFTIQPVVDPAEARHDKKCLASGLCQVTGAHDGIGEG